MANLEDLIIRDTTVNRPAAGIAGRLFYDITADKMQRDNGNLWEDCEPSASTAAASLITNGHFDSDATGWSATSPATVAQSSGTLLVSRNNAGATDDHGYQDITVVSGRIYLVSCRITALTAGAIIGIKDNSVFYQFFYTVITGRTHAVCFMHLANSTTLRFVVRASDNTTATVNIDDVVIVEL